MVRRRSGAGSTKRPTIVTNGGTAAAIARARALGRVAPFFIDADAEPNPGGYPIGGLTVVTFRNAHLIYALTWFALAALSLAGLFLARRPVQWGS